MTKRRDLLAAAPAAWALLGLSPAAITVPTGARADDTAAPGTLWRSPTLREETVTAKNGAITTAPVAGANDRLAMTERLAIEVVPDVWLLAGWGIAHSMAIRAPKGWIIVDTGDSTRAAQEMRDTLQAATGGPVRVAAILFTHWHYSDGTAAWADDGAELWGHEWLDRNRTASVGLGPLSGVFKARAASQFGVFHPPEGPDAFPNNLGFTPDRLLAESSYRPPERLFTNASVQTLTVAGEEVTVMPNRTDATDSVGFWFPRFRLLITNCMAPGFMFNLSSLRGGPLRDPTAYLEDARHLEAYDAAILLDLHAAPLKGEDAVRSAIRRSADRIRLIRDQSVRMIGRGMDGRAAAEAVVMPASLREDYEFYGQVESQVRQIYNAIVSWFGNDVYDINPLPVAEEARRTIALMGGPGKVRAAADEAAGAGDIADWQWALRLTSLLLQLDPQDKATRAVRANAARALGQRTTSSNARGWYITEALEMDGQLLAMGRPVTMAQLRAVLVTPGREDLIAAGTAAMIDFLPTLIDPSKAGDAHATFSLQVEGDAAQWRIEMRNGVILTEPAAAQLPDHVTLAPAALADFILGRSPPPLGKPLATIDAALDRSAFLVITDAEIKALSGRAAEVHLLGGGSQ